MFGIAFLECVALYHEVIKIGVRVKFRTQNSLIVFLIYICKSVSDLGFVKAAETTPLYLN